MSQRNGPLAKLRESCGLSPMAACRLAGIEYETLRRLELALCKPTRRTILKIALSWPGCSIEKVCKAIEEQELAALSRSA